MYIYVLYIYVMYIYVLYIYVLCHWCVEFLECVLLFAYIVKLIMWR